jgi:hypothetical protein
MTEAVQNKIRHSRSNVTAFSAYGTTKHVDFLAYLEVISMTTKEYVRYEQNKKKIITVHSKAFNRACRRTDRQTGT